MNRALTLGCFLLLSVPVIAGDQTNPAKQRSAIGTLLTRAGADAAWTTPLLGAAIKKDSFLLTLPGARGVVDSRGGALGLTLAGNLPDFSATPVLECAIQIHDPAERDVDFTLDRGRIILENRKNTRAKARIHIQDKRLDIELLGKDSVVAVELFSRWPVGTHFQKKPKADHKPLGELFLFVLKGKAEVFLENEKHPMEGPSYCRWDTAKGAEGPLALPKLPEWADPAADTSAKAGGLHTAVEKLRRTIADKGLEKGLAYAMAQPGTVAEVAILSAVALEKVGSVWTVLNEGKSTAARAAAANALRHFIDRGSKQALSLHEQLMAQKVKAGQAEIVLELMHGIGPEARNRPETYDTLISYLGSDLQAIRELAHRNLIFLAPAGRSITFDAAASADARAKSQAGWRKLIPEGRVPTSK